jgi:NAD(P)-dependent dehydrogenase (short-subunit alcohol dehydrogenase family)
MVHLCTPDGNPSSGRDGPIFAAIHGNVALPMSRGTIMPHPALSKHRVAVITGGASGIGLAAAIRFAGMGMKVAIADLGADRLKHAAGKIAAAAANGAADVTALEADVSNLDDLAKLERAVTGRFGGTDVLMNNAGIQPPTTALGSRDNWERIVGVNLWGVVNGTQAFAPAMIARGRPGLIINTGSKQGITTPPGNPAYNVSKAGVKAFTEALQHELRNTPDCRISAHLLIPGFVYTALTKCDRTEKPDAAWTPEQTVDFMLTRIAAGDFYILCPDNDVPRALDEKRMAWAIGDIIDNRPPLSRWHPDYADAFKAWVEK